MGLECCMKALSNKLVLGSLQTQQARRWNIAVLRCLLTESIANRSPLVLPAGVIEVEVDPGQDLYHGVPRGIVISGDASLIGQGAGSTVLDCYPKNPAFDFELFHIDGTQAPRNVRFANLTINGPSNPDPSLGNVLAIRHFGQIGTPLQDAITIDGCCILGQWSHGCSSSNGRTVVRVSHSEIEGRDPALSAFNNSVYGKTFHAEYCTFRTVGDMFGVSGAVGIYIAPSVSTRISNCNFYHSGTSPSRFGIYLNGTDSTACDYAIIEGCYFDASLDHGIQGEVNAPALMISSSQFRCKTLGVYTRRNTIIKGCRFDIQHTAVGLYGNATGRRILIDGCQINNTIPATTADNLINAAGEADWEISDTEFDAVSPVNHVGIYNPIRIC